MKNIAYNFPIKEMELEEWIDTLPAGADMKIERSVSDNVYITSLVCSQTNEVYVVGHSNFKELKRPKKGGMARLNKRLRELSGDE